MAEALQAAPPDTQGDGENSIISSLLEVADQAGQNPFDVHEHVNSLLAGFPLEASVMLLLELIASKKAVIDQAVAGFVLHPDAVLAQSAADALAASAKRTPVESSLIERLVRMRPWLPQTGQAHLDATIRAVRLNALPPVKLELPKVIKCYVSVCDGSGTRRLFVTQRVGADYQLASVMMKLAGVADAMVLSQGGWARCAVPWQPCAAPLECRAPARSGDTPSGTLGPAWPRDPESISAYVRIATQSLREVSPPVPT